MTLTPLPEFTNFSRGYWLVEGFEVVPDDVDRPLVQDHLYSYVQDEYYGDLSVTMTFRRGKTDDIFVVEPDETPRIHEILMPVEMVASMEIDPSPETTHFLLAKPEHAKMIERLDPGRDEELL